VLTSTFFREYYFCKTMPRSYESETNKSIVESDIILQENITEATEYIENGKGVVNQGSTPVNMITKSFN